MAHDHHELDYANSRLQLVGSRVIESETTGRHVIQPSIRRRQHHRRRREQDSGKLHHNTSRDAPVFEKTESASNFELFYDLWFVANLNVFTSIHDISNLEQFNSFLGYMFLLWTTWLLTTLYDVRFAADSVVERVCKAVHLGVMIGFSEVGTSFDPKHQIISVFRALSLFLAVSRFALACQYGLVAFQVRKYAGGWRPLSIVAFLHFAASMVYLGVSFRYDLDRGSKIYLVWYIGSGFEFAIHLIFSRRLSETLTFIGTHLGERMNLLTLVILGEGCIVLAKSVTLLVEDTYLKDNTTTWSPTLIGLVVAAAALIYTIFQLYFDWMDGENSMSKRHQVWWTALHLPFHLSLTLLLEGMKQFILWARVMEVLDATVTNALEVIGTFDEDSTSQEVSDTLSDLVMDHLKEYPPAEPVETIEFVQERLAAIADIPESANSSAYEPDVTELLATMVNAVYSSFEIEAPENATGTDVGSLQSDSTIAIVYRFQLVFEYAFACAGIVLLFLTLMHVISKRNGWSPFNIVRAGFGLATAVVLALLTILAADPDSTFQEGSFVGSTWMLPTLTIAFFAVLVVTHLPHPPKGFGTGRYGAVRSSQDYKDVESQRRREAKETYSLRPLSPDEENDTAYAGAGAAAAAAAAPNHHRAHGDIPRSSPAHTAPTTSPGYAPGYNNTGNASYPPSAAPQWEPRRPAPETVPYDRDERFQSLDIQDYNDGRQAHLPS
ncbi:hypothetical protein F4778DRAFT_733253 [Xylariomycetidae sp. FL2044]|nr:hypothetical protein F4778DRAFT_733253 [Xylariomycetidae sp. FL2044]